MGYLEASNEIPVSTKIRTGLVGVVLWLKIIGNRLGILTSVLIANDYFSRCQKSTFNLENNTRMSMKLFVYHVTVSTYSGIIFWGIYTSRLYKKLWKELEKLTLYQSWQLSHLSWVMRQWSLFKEKLKLSKLEY